MKQLDSLTKILQRLAEERFYGELSFVFQNGTVVLIRENKTIKLQTDRSDRTQHDHNN
jgi:hypothetical protein